jgi:hypothetical protein
MVSENSLVSQHIHKQESKQAATMVMLSAFPYTLFWIELSTRL